MTRRHLAIGPLYHSAPCVHAPMALNLGHAVVVAPRFRLKHPRRVEFRASLRRTPSGKLGRRRVGEDYLRERTD